MASSSSIDIDMAGCFAEGTAPCWIGWCGGGTKRLCGSRGLFRGGCGRLGVACEVGARGLGACREVQEDNGGARRRRSEGAGTEDKGGWWMEGAWQGRSDARLLAGCLSSQSSV